MVKSNTNSSTYWKQAENGLLAHVYEHVASSYVSDYLVRNGLYFIADFDHWARTYGTVLYLDFSSHSKEAVRALRKAFLEFSKTTLSFEQVQRAAQQIAIEYERPLVEFEVAFVDELRTLHTKPWTDINKLGVFQAEETTSVNTVFSMNGIRYGRKTPKSFVPVTLHFEVNKTAYATNPAMKALAVLLTQAVALNLHKNLEDTYVYYDMGDEWNKGAKTVAYRTELVFLKNMEPSIEGLQQKADTYLQSLQKSSLSRTLQHLLRHTYVNERDRYFSLESMNEITNGILIGYTGWKSVANNSTIELLLENLSIKVLK